MRLCAGPRPKYQARRMARVRQPRLRVPQPSYLPASRSGQGTTVTPSRRTTAVQPIRHEQPRPEWQTCQRVSFLRGRGTGPSQAADRKQRALLGPTGVPCGPFGAVARQQKMVGRRWEQAAQTGVLLSGGDACELPEGLAQAAPLGGRICPSHPQLSRQGAAACWIFVQRPLMISSS